MPRDRCRPYHLRRPGHSVHLPAHGTGGTAKLILLFRHAAGSCVGPVPVHWRMPAARASIKDFFPPDGMPQRIYCDRCKGHLDLSFGDFDEVVSDIHIAISGLPTLICEPCGTSYLPDRSRFAVIELHRQAMTKNVGAVSVTRRKQTRTFAFTKVPFLYDADDYDYIPGLRRTHDEGFLTPVFFSRDVLLKYDAHPSYRVTFASRTYGNIEQGDDFRIPFGINRNARVVMWLGDIARLPENEQFYLRSENVPSDHSIGSEFYDGQIECVFTKRSPEDQLFEQRSQFLEACFHRFGQKVAHLEQEVLDLAVSVRRPVVDTRAERRHIADALNKIYLESLDNNALGVLLSQAGHDASKLGSLKRLQKLLETLGTSTDIAAAMTPLYVLYDLRVAYSHLGSAESEEERIASICQRLGLDAKADLLSVYDVLVSRLQSCFKALVAVTQTS